jgi:CheY-like chemotaxis protein
MKKIIWVVDDDIIYQTIIKKLIQKSECFSAFSNFINGKEVLTALYNTFELSDENLPDIILLDINMPVMDGWEFMDEFKTIKSKISKKINIYIVSSSIAIEDKKKAKTYIDIIDYIPKPITVNMLTALTSKE